MTTLPDLIPTLSFEEILKANINRLKELLPDYTPAQGDDMMLVLQDFSYREMLLREFIQEQVEGNFLMTAKGAKLDHLCMTLYGIERLQGSKPYTTATLSLSRELPYDVIIPKGYELLEDGGVYRALTTEAATIPTGETETVVTVELDAMLTASAVRCEIAVEQIPYLGVSQNGDFANGGDLESDEELRERALLSLSRTSAAGSRNAYIGYTYAADERIAEVSVYAPSAGEVHVIYWAAQMDALMQQRVEDALTAEDVRPVTDHVTVAAATVQSVDISVLLIVRPGSDSAKLVAAVRAQIEALFASPQIGRDVTLSRLMRACVVEGVDDVQITAPVDNITVEADAVAVLGAVNISTQESGDVY